MRRRLLWGSALLLVSLGVAGWWFGREPAAPPLATSGPRLEATLVRMWKPHASPLRGVEFAGPDRLVSGAADGKIVVQSLDGRAIRSFEHPGGVAWLSVSPDAASIATGGYDGVVRLWRTVDGAPAGTLGFGGPVVWTLAFSPDGKTLASAGEEKAVRIWDLPGGTLRHRLTGHALNIWALSFSPEGSRVASGSFDRTLKIWDARSGKLIRSVAGHDEAIVGTAWSRQGLIASGGDDDRIKLWTADGAPTKTLYAGHHVHNLAFSPDGRWLAAGGSESAGLQMLWRQLFGSRIGGGNGVTVRIFRLADGQPVAAMAAQAGEIRGMGMSPDGSLLATGAEDGSIALYRLAPRA